MIIDETKEYATYRLDQQNQDLKNTYSNHNVILLKIDFHMETIQTKECKKMSINKLIATGQMQNSYGKWCEVVEQSIERVTKKDSKTNSRRDIRQLMKMRKNLSKELN